jgi:hypothetical protein
VLGIILILVGGFFFVHQALPGVDLGVWWPVAAVVIGAVLVVMSVLPGRSPR